jgi:hypothetical protein
MVKIELKCPYPGPVKGETPLFPDPPYLSTLQSLQAIYGSGPLDPSGQPNYHDTFLDGGYVNAFIKITLGRTPNLNCVPLLPDSAVTAGTTGNGTAPAPSPSPGKS